jgi:predicted nuclease of predicted toxin-antitoxin system
MKLLFDENLSPSLPRLLAMEFPDSTHVRDCGLKGQPDDVLWDYAGKHGYVLVSKDSDFYERSLLFGPPPKFVWLCLGNCTRDAVVALLTRRRAEIAAPDTAGAEATLILLP